MPDNPLPPTGPLADTGAPAPPRDGIQPSLNGTGAVHARPAEAPQAPPSQQLLYLGMQAGLLAVTWLVAFLFLRSYAGLLWPEAVGLAVVIAVVGTFFTRSLLPHPEGATSAPPVV